MTYKLYFRGRLLSIHADFEDAMAQARWTYFEWSSMAWEGLYSPPGFLIACINTDKLLNSQDNKVMCS